MILRNVIQARVTIPVIVLTVILCASVFGYSAARTGPYPGSGPWLQYADPADGGFRSAYLDSLHAKAESIRSDAVIIIRGGLVVAAWGEIDRPFKCASIRKSLLSGLYGQAVSEGRIDLTDTLDDLGIDDRHGLTELERSATVEHLLQSRSGIYHPAAMEPRSMKGDRPDRGTHEPGAHFWYNNWNFNAAGHIYESVTGEDIFTAFRQRFADPLGMEDFSVDLCVDFYERRLSSYPGFAFRMSARDLARFGLLYLRAGRWGEEELLSSDWIEATWTSYSQDPRGGYGYMWWIHGPGFMASRPELEAFAASGLGGQLLVTVPAEDLIIVHRADTDFGRGARSDDVWDLVRDIVLAIDGDAHRTQKLIEVEPRPFSRPLPRLPEYDYIELPQSELERFVGRYVVEGGQGATLSQMDGMLIGHLTGLGEADFFPIGPSRFHSPATGATLSFAENDRGEISEARFEVWGRKMIGRRQ